ncbi:hypothetical protein [Phycicoccus sp. Root563]|uniref:hypothetical protein n=1 Tax=Phycicoccus sp. Root563 TaxID=1736562 RepID=UPI0007037CFA|nr:hypothetical protein [Phycicoccus sp. Root563]KQZ89907.1 hypothetical protein ASD62_11960 [Phycicoccus sp. Root563]
MSLAERRDAVGTHQLPRRVLQIALTLLCVSAIVLAAGAAWGFHRGGHPWWLLAEMLAVLTWMLLFTSLLHSRTVVEASGLRIRSGWRWRQVSWGEIDSFASTTGGLASPEIVTLRTTSGRKVMTQIPSRLLPELESYATEHGFHGS